MSHFMMLCLLPFLLEMMQFGFVSEEERGVSVAWCKNSEKGEWQHLLDELFSGTDVIISKTDCDLGEGGVAVLITYENGEIELLQRGPHQNIHNFLASALRKVSSRKIINISKNTDWNTIPKRKEFIVCYTHYRDSLEHVIFQQAALSADDILLIVTHDTTLLPDEVQETSTRSLHVWVVADGQWGQVHLNEQILSPAELRNAMKNLMSRLDYSPIHTYTGDDPEILYQDSGLHPIMVFHDKEDHDNIVDNIIHPLVKEFRSYYTFITIDVTEYPQTLLKYKIDENETMPYIIVMDPTYVGGLHLDKENIKYTPERLRNYLKSLVLPGDKTNRKFGDEGVFLFDTRTLNVLCEEETDASILAGFCEKETEECQSLYNDMMNAVKESLSETGSKLDMLLCVTVCDNLEEVNKYEVDVFPSVSLRYMGVWQYVDERSVSNYVELIKKFGRVIEKHEEL